MEKKADIMLRNRVREQYGTYHDILVSHFQHSLAVSTPEHSSAGSKLGSTHHKLTIESYDVVQGCYPSEDRVKEADGMLLTGSGKFTASSSDSAGTDDYLAPGP